MAMPQKEGQPQQTTILDQALEQARLISEGLKIKFLIWRADGIFSLTPIQFEPNAKESYISARRRGYAPVSVFSHQVHLDALGAAYVNRQLRTLEAEHGIVNPTPGHIVTLAKSVDTGDQGELLQKGFREMKIYFDKLDMKTVLYAREEDKTYGLTPNGREVAKTLLHAAKENLGLSFFPEGRVHAGRRKPKEKPAETALEQLVQRLEDIGLIQTEINGMQPFDGTVLLMAKRIVEQIGKRAAFTPVGIHGVFRLLKPTYDHKAFVTPFGYIAAALPFDLGLVSIRVGMTETSDDIQEKLKAQGKEFNPTNVADYLGGRIAKLLPPQARGVYKEAA